MWKNSHPALKAIVTKETKVILTNISTEKMFTILITNTTIRPAQTTINSDRTRHVLGDTRTVKRATTLCILTLFHRR